MGVAQPTGTVTFLFSDVEGSTRLLGSLGAERYADALSQHRRLAREAFDRHDGFEVGTEGDSFFIAFSSAEDAIAAAAETQQALAAGSDLRVRMGVHTGEPLQVGSDYVGIDVHRAARIMAAGHGGQVLVSETTAALLNEISLRDLGPQRLKDLVDPIRLYQLVLDGLPDEFPPLKSMHRTNLPAAAWPLLGREEELATIAGLVSGGARLVTLTGPGGSGKTRLALQSAAELSDEFNDGVFFVGLAPLRDRDAVRAAVAEGIGLQPADDVVGWLESHRVLLVLDNLEHLAGVDGVVSELLIGETTLLATSRTPLRLTAERELPVEPLPESAAVELFVSRAAAAGRPVAADETVAAVCRRLDNLPLALELAAARAKILSPSALLQRLDAALPLLTGGSSDRPERQRTLRATIEWSHDLLEPGVRSAFRRLAVFRGSFTLDAAEAVAHVNLDQVASLLDHSLLKPVGDDRFFLLETIREYAGERLGLTDETVEFRSRHARYYLMELKSRESLGAGARLAWYADEEDNLRAMLDQLMISAPADAAQASEFLGWYWRSRGAYLERRRRVEALLALAGLSDDSRCELLLSLASTTLRLGDDDGTGSFAGEALALAEPGTAKYAYALSLTAIIELRRGNVERSVERLRTVVNLARGLPDQTRLSILIDAGVTLADAGHVEEAMELFIETRDGFGRIGSEIGTAVASENLAWLDLGRHEFESAHAAFSSTSRKGRTLGHVSLESSSLRGLGLALLGLGRPDEARAAFVELLELERHLGKGSVDIVDAIAGVALSAMPAQAGEAARLRGAVAALRQRIKRDWQLGSDALEGEFELRLAAAAGRQIWLREQAIGAELSLDEAVQLARNLAGR